MGEPSVVSAAEVVAEAVQEELSLGGDPKSVASHVMNMLTDQRYAVVKLPDPRDIEDDYALVGNEIRHYARNGFGAHWRFDIDEAATLAAALLSLCAAYTKAVAEADR